MKNITRSLILFLSVFCLMSCSNDDEKTTDKENYELGSVLWTLLEGDGEEYFEIETPELVYKNPGNVTKEVVINPQKDLEETSEFFIDESVLPILPEEGISITIPSKDLSLKTDYRYLVGGTKAPFQNGKTILPPTSTVTNTFTLAPSTEMRYKSTFIMKKITATYRACFVSKDGTDSYEKEGKWVGIFIFGENNETVFNDIK